MWHDSSVSPLICCHRKTGLSPGISCRVCLRSRPNLSPWFEVHPEYIDQLLELSCRVSADGVCDPRRWHHSLAFVCDVCFVQALACSIHSYLLVRILAAVTTRYVLSGVPCCCGPEDNMAESRIAPGAQAKSPRTWCAKACSCRSVSCHEAHGKPGLANFAGGVLLHANLA